MRSSADPRVPEDKPGIALLVYRSLQSFAVFILNYVSLVFEPVQKNQKGVWAQACLDASLPRDFLGRLVSRPLFDFSAAKRTNTHQDEVIILALAKSCYSTHNSNTSRNQTQNG